MFPSFSGRKLEEGLLGHTVTLFLVCWGPSILFSIVAVYNEILLSHKKRWNNVICDNMNGPWEYHAKQNKSDRSQESFDFTHMGDIKLKTINKQTRKINIIDIDKIWWLPSEAEGGR